MTGLFTLLTPLAARISMHLLIAVRVLEGFFEVSCISYNCTLILSQINFVVWT